MTAELAAKVGRSGSWHIIAESDRRRHVRILAPAVRAEGGCRCDAYAKVDGYGAVCSRHHGHTGRHAAYGPTLVVAVWP